MDPLGWGSGVVALEVEMVLQEMAVVEMVLE
jgi:hypothetical protein